jgi:hypothetical protein
MKKLFIPGMFFSLCMAAVFFGCATRNLSVSTIPGGVKTFSMYGFSFKYPADFSLYRMGSSGKDADDRSGVVIVSRENPESKLWAYQVTWFETYSTYNEIMLEENIDEALAGLESTEGIIGVERGEIENSEISDYPMFFRHYSSTSTAGEKVSGIISSFYCQKNSKVFAVMTMRSSVVSVEEILQDFLGFMSSFSCY